MPLNAPLVRKTFAAIESSADADRVTGYFYGRLFAENPELRALFPPAMDGQRGRLFSALTQVVAGLDDLDALGAFLSQLGRDHRKFGVEDQHYAAVGAALLATIRRFLGDAWTPEVADAWSEAYGLASRVMIEAAEEHSAWAPPWWQAEVVELQRPWRDIVRLTLRPNQPYPFLPGQYLPLQTARWPRVWRRYSIANAPRSDNLLQLVVRSVPGGWVSGALQRHTQRGDVMLLGAPQGSMVLDATSNRDLVCAAGGTGIAPLKALLEQVVNLPRRRSVLLLYAADTPEELTELGDLLAIRATYPWLRLVQVVRDPGPGHAEQALTGDGADVVRGTLPEVIAGLGPFDDHDAYVCGPEGMVRAAVAELGEAGVPGSRIRHDLLGGAGAADSGQPQEDAETSPLPAVAASERSAASPVGSDSARGSSTSP